MVHPPNRDYINFTEKRFQQDSEHKRIDRKIAAAPRPPLRAPQAELSLACHSTQCMRQAASFPGIPKGTELKGKLSGYEILSPV